MIKLKARISKEVMHKSRNLNGTIASSEFRPQEDQVLQGNIESPLTEWACYLLQVSLAEKMEERNSLACFRLPFFPRKRLVASPLTEELSSIQRAQGNKELKAMTLVPI